MSTLFLSDLQWAAQDCSLCACRKRHACGKTSIKAAGSIHCPLYCLRPFQSVRTTSQRTRPFAFEDGPATHLARQQGRQVHEARTFRADRILCSFKMFSLLSASQTTSSARRYLRDLWLISSQDLPQITVIGSQSSGKSSVLEVNWSVTGRRADRRVEHCRTGFFAARYRHRHSTASGQRPLLIEKSH